MFIGTNKVNYNHMTKVASCDCNTINPGDGVMSHNFES